MRIFLVGGGTGGPSAPLLAVAEALRESRQDSEFFFIGTKKGVERKLLAATDLPVKFLTIPAGKWRRPFSWLNVLDLFRTAAGFLRSLYLVAHYRPDVIFAAGSYVQVPVVWAGFLLRVPAVVHQQDFRLSFATRLAAPAARAVTVCFSYSERELPEFSGLFRKLPKSKVHVTGNPVRREILRGSAAEARKIFGLGADFPTVLIMGGGMGAKRLNEIVVEALPELTRYVQIIHVTGGKSSGQRPAPADHYHAYDFLGKNLNHAYAVADLVISRGGMSTITELSALGKAAILVPLPGSPQEDNVRLLAVLKLAIGVFEEMLTSEVLVSLVRKVLWDPNIQRQLREDIKNLNQPGADKQIAKLILRLGTSAKKNGGN